jgi:hypothetical protein
MRKEAANHQQRMVLAQCNQFMLARLELGQRQNVLKAEHKKKADAEKH